MKKIIGLRKTDEGVWVVDIESWDVYDLVVGAPCRIDNNRLLCHESKGIISGFHTNFAGNHLVKVKWLDGAPPLMIRPDYVVSLMPKRFWMVAPLLADGRTEYVHSDQLAYRRAGLSAPTHVYTSKQEAIDAMHENQRLYNREYVIMQSMVVSNGSTIVAL